MYSNFFIWKTWTLLADLLWAKLNLDATPSICWMVERSLLNLKIPCGKCTKSLTHMLIGSALSGKLSQPGLAIILQVFPNCRWMFFLVLRSYSESKELYVLRTLKLWLEKKRKKKPSIAFFLDWKSHWRQWTSSKRQSSASPFGVLVQSPSGPIHKMRTIRRPACSHNWSTFIHIKGWESLKLLTVQCFYSSHLPCTYRFRISPNWITRSRPNDLSCPSTIYHIVL